MIETPEWRQKIRAAKNSIAAESAEGAAMMRRHEGRAFRFAERLLAVTRVILQENRARLLDTGWSVVIMGIFVKMISVLRGALPLAKGGHGRELPIMIRPALEALITILFIVQQDSALRARRWVQFRFVVQLSLMENHPALFRGPKHRNARRRVRARANRVRANFPTKRFWAAGLGCGSLRDMAEKVDMLWHYNTIYWMGSQPTHASAIAVEEHVDVGAENRPVYKMGLSGKGVHREMAAYCFLLIRGLDQINDSCDLSITAVTADLKSEYASLFRKTLDHGGN